MVVSTPGGNSQASFAERFTFFFFFFFFWLKTLQYIVITPQYLPKSFRAWLAELQGLAVSASPKSSVV
jgi:hypothetical protein